MGKLDDYFNKTKVIEIKYYDKNNKVILYDRSYFRKEIKILQELTAFILFNQEAPLLLAKLKKKKEMK